MNPDAPLSSDFGTTAVECIRHRCCANSEHIKPSRPETGLGLSHLSDESPENPVKSLPRSSGADQVMQVVGLDDIFFGGLRVWQF